MRHAKKLSILASALLLSCATPAAQPSGPTLESITASRLERFESEAAFIRYLRDARAVALRAGGDWVQPDKYVAGQWTTSIPIPAPPPPPPPPPAPAAAPSTAPTAAPTPAPQQSASTSENLGSFPDSAVAEALQRIPGIDEQGFGDPESITNVQTRGVDEGDIVKRIGRFLVVLQDGRLFTVDMQPGEQAGLRYVDRINVYRNRNAGTWYDEMLVAGNRVLVTGYSYAQSATELSVFSLNNEGRLTREGVYYMSSNDYYDIENYATRLVGDNLVIYTPLDLTSVDPDRPLDWPVVRRWVSGEGERAVFGKAERLFDARDIYRPLQQTIEPTVHSISVCPLGSLRRGDELQCTATAFVGPPQREFYISPEAAYLWMTSESGRNPNPCAPEGVAFNAAPRATLIRAPFGGEPGAMHVRGFPRDQMGFASTRDEFRALLHWSSGTCGSQSRVNFRYFSTPLSAFANTPPTIGEERFIVTPPLNAGMYEQRFTENYVIYGGRANWSSYPPANAPTGLQIVAVPTSAPQNATVLDSPHNILRIERVGNNAVLTGYRDETGLRLSLLDLSATPRFTAATLLRDRYESEGRSHAFNSRVDSADSGLIGIPTVLRAQDANRYWFRSESSDISFLSFDDGAFAQLGVLMTDRDTVDDSYRCEVSCVDWYGNSRPFFIGGRIFALLGTEIVEGEIQNGRIRSVRRANLTGPAGR